MPGRLGTFHITRRNPERICDFYAAGREPQRLNYEAGNYRASSRTLIYKVGHAWHQSPALQSNLYRRGPLFTQSVNMERETAAVGPGRLYNAD